jgi:hypothetical protein
MTCDTENRHADGTVAGTLGSGKEKASLLTRRSLETMPGRIGQLDEYHNH